MKLSSILKSLCQCARPSMLIGGVSHITTAGALLVSVTLAYADAPPASDNRIPGYFLGTFLSLGHSWQYLEEIKSVCDRHSRVWAHGSSETFRCIHFGYAAEAVDGPVYTLGIESSNPNGDLSHYLFSVRPFPVYEWKSRPANAAEIKSVSTLFKKDEMIFKVVNDVLSAGNATVMDIPRKDATIYIVRLHEAVNEQTEGEPQEDLEPPNEQHVVVMREQNKYYNAGEITGSIVDIVDLDGDGFPEIEVNRNCIGTCLSVISLKNKGAPLMSISQH